MANATVRVSTGTTEYQDNAIRRKTDSTATIYYPGAMAALDGSGLATKCDNTAGLTFDGIIADSVRLQFFSGDDPADPAKLLTIQRPFRIQMYIASAVLADIGKAVYALYDNEVAYSTTNSILVGWVDDVISSTFVSIRPAWLGQKGVASFDGATLTFDSTTGLNIAVFPDNLADALSFKEGSNSYLTFKTTDGSETVLVKKLLDVVAGINFSGLTTTNILKMADNLADALNVKEGANSYLKFVTTDGSEAIVLGKAATGVSLAVTAGLTSSGSTGAGIGYTTGAGGAVIQATNRTTGVTLSKLCGKVTTTADSMAAQAPTTFTVTNTTVAATDTIVLTKLSGDVDTFAWVDSVAAGSFTVTLFNSHASAADTTAFVFNFAVVKAVAA